MGMEITKEQLKSKREIGNVDGRPIYQIVTKGGFNIVAMLSKSGSLEILAVANHPGISQWQAEKKAPKATWTNLRKADYCPYEAFSHLVGPFGQLTDQFQAAADELFGAK